MPATLFTDVMIFDGTGDGLFPGQVLVEGNRIAAVARGADGLAARGAAIIEGCGATLMPGLIESHAHLTFPSAIDRIAKQHIPPVERHVFQTAHNAKTLLDYGFTAAYSGGATKPAVEIAVRDEIAAGYIPGPRLKASSFERSATGERMAFGQADEVRKWAEEMIALGVDSLKVVLSGKGALERQFWDHLNYGDDDLTVLSRLAGERGINLSCHAMTAAAVKLAARYGFHAIYHCNFADAEALDMLESRKDAIFVSPAVGILVADIGLNAPVSEAAQVALDGMCRVIPEMRRRGIRVLPGGDYGFPHNPNGRNARDMELFVTKFGYEPREVLRAATKHGGEMMGMGDTLGLVRQGYLADLILVKGDPTRDIALLQDKDNLLAIMQDGAFHKRPVPVAETALAHAR